MLTTARPGKKQETLRVAMLAKAAHISGGKQHPIIITAGECGVFFAEQANMREGMRFTVQEWFDLVDFVNQQLISGDVVSATMGYEDTYNEEDFEALGL